MKTVCIIVNYNDENMTIRQLKKIVGYTCLDRIIVVDNASADTSRIRLISYIRHDTSGKLELAERDTNGGYGAGNNTGLLRAAQLGARYALIANPDADYDEKTVERLIEIMDRHDELAVVAPLMRMPQAAGEQTVPGTYANTIMAPVAWPLRPWWKELLEMGPVSRRVFNRFLHYPPEHYQKHMADKAGRETVYTGTGGNASMRSAACDIYGYDIPATHAKQQKKSQASEVMRYASCVYVDAVPGSLLLADVAKVRSVGGYDEEMFLYGEETLLARRLADAGYRTALCLSESYMHLHRGSVPSMKSQLEREKSMKYYMSRYLGAGELKQKIADAFFSVIHAQMRLRDCAQRKLISSQKWQRAMFGTHGKR